MRQLHVIVTLAIAVVIGGCDALATRQLSIRSESEGGTSLQSQVETTFDEFARTRGFVCQAGSGPAILKDCSGRGPQFLELHRSREGFTIYLRQPYPGGLFSSPPESYDIASRELELSLKRQFGDTRVVVVR